MSPHITQRDSWLAKGPTRQPNDIPAELRRGVTYHWNGPALKLNLDQERTALMVDEMAKLRAIQNYHMNNLGWSDTAYSFAVGQSGALYEMRGEFWDQFANGSDDVGEENGSDSEWYTLFFMIGEGEEPTQAAIDAAINLTAHLRDLGAGYQVRPHSDFKVKSCPGDHVRSLARQLHLADITVTTSETVLVAGLPASGLMQAGAYGDQVVQLQIMLDHFGMEPGPIDGDFGPKTEAALRRLQESLEIPETGVYDLATFSAASNRIVQETQEKSIQGATITEDQIGKTVIQPEGVTTAKIDPGDIQPIDAAEVIDATARRKARKLDRRVSALEGDFADLGEHRQTAPAETLRLIEGINARLDVIDKKASTAQANVTWARAKIGVMEAKVDRADAFIDHVGDYEE